MNKKYSTNLLESSDLYEIDTLQSFDSIISILKQNIYLNDAIFNGIIFKETHKKYVGEYCYPNRFLVRNSSNPMMGGLNLGTVTEIDIDKKDNINTIKFKVNNLGSKMIFVALSAGLILLSLIGLIAFRKEYFILLGFLFILGLIIYGIGYLLHNMVIKEQFKYFYRILK